MIESDAVVRTAPTGSEHPTSAAPVAKVTALDHVTVQTADVDAAVAFYRDVWGLVTQPVGSDGAVALRGPDPAAPALVLLPSDRNGLHHVAFRVRSLEGPDAPTSLACTERAGARRQVLTDPDGRTVELVNAEVPDAQPPAGARAGSDDHVTVPTMGHVVLASPDLEANEAFYRDRLGFRPTDRTARGMVFLRCNTDHHTLAIARTTVPGVQHVAYDVGSIDRLMQNLACLRDGGVACIWGPGRHGPGHNVFAYYRDPLGCAIEQFADMEQTTPDEPVEERWWGPDWPGDLWGLAGPPSPEFLDSVLAVGSAG